jgi:hypothetical protein
MRRFFVARFTQNSFMRAFQRKTRHRVMVKGSNLPVFAIMAFCAIGSVPAFMAIIFFMATDAGHWGFLDRAIGAVASRTRSCGVNA